MLKISNLIHLVSILGFGCIGCQTNIDKPLVNNMVSESSLPIASTKKVEVSPIDTAYLLGKFDQTKHPEFVAISQPYTTRAGMTLHKEAFEAFKIMFDAAKKEGITLNIISSTRNFEQQKKIWEEKWSRFAKEKPAPKDRALKILEYSSMPGSSRHHWGTDIDLNDLNNAAFEENGQHESVYLWLTKHAAEFGFCQPYTAGRPHGYHEEKWHWTYTPLSKKLFEAYKNNLKDTDITGFKGADLAPEIQVVKHYVLGINTECQ